MSTFGTSPEQQS